MGMLTEHPLSARIDASSHVTICGYIVQSCGMTPTEATRLTPDEDHMIWAAIISAGRSDLLSALRIDLQSISEDAERGALISAWIPKDQFLEILTILRANGQSDLTEKLEHVLAVSSVSSVGFDWKLRGNATSRVSFHHFPVKKQPNSLEELWAVHVLGPDDLHAAASHADALALCDELNALGLQNNAGKTPGDLRYVIHIAYPLPWPYSAEAHAESLAQRRKDEAEWAARKAAYEAKQQPTGTPDARREAREEAVPRSKTP